jgi:aspartate/methionine/tyrosine aminotransferase
MELEQQVSESMVELQQSLLESYQEFKTAGLSLDLTRGKPSSAQLDLSNSLDGILNGEFTLPDGTDVRNYGGITGIAAARKLGAEMLDMDPQHVMVGGNSSLTFMYQYIAFALLHGANGKESSWKSQADRSGSPVRFLCPVPGYDRHFTICEHFGIEMINIDFTDAGPDMDQIEALVAADPMIKGIWCVPKYSNPTGHTYSESVVKRMAGLGKIAGGEFRIMWDNAYTVHYLNDKPADLTNLYAEAVKLGTEDSVVITGSTSKITFAGAGISFLCTSSGNLKAFQKHLSASSIGPDKINQERHVRFLKDIDGVLAHMSSHQAILKPKFDKVQEILHNSLHNKNMGEWTVPTGGYFVSFDTLPGLAKEVVRLAKDAGVTLTPAGATYPYGQDCADRNIRLSPTFPNLDDLEQAMNIFVLCVQLASVKQAIAASA